MALYRLENVETGKVKRYLRMGAEDVDLMNTEEEAPWEWRKGLRKTSTYSKPVGSLAKVLRTLDCEGFSEYALNQIQRFTRRNEIQAAKGLKEREAIKARFSKIMKGLSRADRVAVGRFVSSQAKISFEAGLKMGLAGKQVQEASKEGDSAGSDNGNLST